MAYKFEAPLWLQNRHSSKAHIHTLIKMTKCSICNKEGHNSRTCAEPEPEPAVVKPKKILKRKEPEPKPEPEPCLIKLPAVAIVSPYRPPGLRNFVVNSSDSRSESSTEKPYASHRDKKRIHEQHVFKQIFHTLNTVKETMEWFLLRDYYYTNPDMFSLVQTAHSSAGEKEQHMSIEVQYKKFNTLNNKFAFVKTHHYHLYIVPYIDPRNPTAQRYHYTYLTSKSWIDGVVYTLADFRVIPNYRK